MTEGQIAQMRMIVINAYEQCAKMAEDAEQPSVAATIRKAAMLVEVTSVDVGFSVRCPALIRNREADAEREGGK